VSASKKDLLGNAAHWLEEAKRNHLGGKGVGAIFIFFNLDTVGSAVCTANVNKEAIKDHLKSILKKLGDGNMIINPWDNN
jgi:hypothetical protein